MRPLFSAPALLTLSWLSLALAGCQATPIDPGDISQYFCPNGLTPRLSLNADKSVMRLSAKGRAYTLRYDEKIAAFSNGKLSAKLDGDLLRLDSTSSLLRQNCRLQIPAKNSAAKATSGVKQAADN